MTETTAAPLPPWPDVPPGAGGVHLRRFEDRDEDMVRDLATDPYVPLIGTLPAGCGRTGALAYLQRQRQRHPDGTGFSFAIADTATDRALGMIGLWLRDYRLGRAQVGYAVAPAARGRGAGSDALRALAGFGWSLPNLHRVEAHIEPWNLASIVVVERAGFGYEGLLRSYLEIGGARRDLGAYSLIRTASPESASPQAVSPPEADRSTVITDR